MKRFNGSDTDQIISRVKNNCTEFIISVLKRHECSETVQKDTKLIELIHTDSVKELEIKPGTLNET